MHLPAQHVEIVGGRRRLTICRLPPAQAASSRSGMRGRNGPARRRRARAAAAAQVRTQGASGPRRRRCTGRTSAGDVEEFAELGFPDHQAVRLGQAVAVLEAQHGVLDQRRVWMTVRLAAPASTTMARAGRLACNSRWRWVKVPRTVSWPPRRTGMPSASSEASASASAVAQSMPVPASIAARRRVEEPRHLRVGPCPAGRRSAAAQLAQPRFAARPSRRAQHRPRHPGQAPAGPSPREIGR